MTLAGRYDELFLDDGAPAPGTLVTVRLPGTSTAATLYTDQTMTAVASNPVTVDASSNLRFWAAKGVYDLFAFGGTLAGVVVNAHPLDIVSSADAVTLTGAQTVAGTKTWAEPARFGSGAPWYDVTAATFGSAASSASSAANKAALNAAVAAASANTYGGELFLPPGSYDFGDAAPVLPGVVSLAGADYLSTIMRFTTDRGAGTHAISSAAGANGVRMRNLAITGPGTSFAVGTAPAGTRGVKLSSRAHLQNVRISGFHSGVQLVGDHIELDDVKCLNNYFGAYFASAVTNGDNTFVGVDLTGNMRASIGVAPTSNMDACTFVRGHLGYSPFCIEWEAGGSPGWTGMSSTEFLGVGWEYAGNGFFYCSDRNVFLYDFRITSARPWTGNAAFKISSLAVQKDFYVGALIGMRIVGDGPTTIDSSIIRASSWEGWKGAYGRAAAAGVTFLKGYMGLSGASGTLALIESDSRAKACNVTAAVTAGQVVEYAGSPHYVRPHNPSAANGGSLVAGVALTSATSTDDVCIVIQEDYEGQSVQVAGAGPYGANDMLFAVGTVGKVDNAAGAGAGYQDKAIIGRVGLTTAVSGGKLAGVLVKVSDRAT